MSEFLLASSFHIASAQNAENGQDVLWTAWGRGARTNFFGDKNSSTFQGDVTTVTLGGDFEWGRTMVGVALSHTLGEGYFSIDGQRSDVEARLSSAYPYIRYTVSKQLTVWGMFGAGNGEYSQQEEGLEKIETDISMRMGAFGFRSSLFPISNRIGYDLAVKGDFMVVEIEADEVRDKLLPVDTNTNRFRLLLEGSREYKFGHGSSVTPSLVVGVRYDKGDAEEGGGIELGGGFQFFDPSMDMQIDVNARGLLLHEENRFSETGVSGSIHFTWGNRKKGLSVRVGSSWGDAASGAERLWSQAAAPGLDTGYEGARFDAEVGYGIDVLHDGGVITPYVGLALAGRGSKIPIAWGDACCIGDHVSLKLEGDRRERVGGKSTHGLALLGSDTLVITINSFTTLQWGDRDNPPWSPFFKVNPIRPGSKACPYDLSKTPRMGAVEEVHRRSAPNFTPPLRGSQRDKGEARRRVGGGSFLFCGMSPHRIGLRTNRSASSSVYPRRIDRPSRGE